MTLTLIPQPPGHCWQTEVIHFSGPGGHGASASSLSISFSRTHPDRASPAKAAVENFRKSRRSSSISRIHYHSERIKRGYIDVIASDQRERGNLAVLYCTIAGLLRRFAPRNDAIINTFVLDRVLTESPMTAIAVGADFFLPMA